MNYINYIVILFGCLLLITVNANAQNLHLNVPDEVEHAIEPTLNAPNVNFHSSIKPYYLKETQQLVSTDSLYRISYLQFNTWMNRKLTNENFFQLDKPKFTLAINPLFNYSALQEINTGKSYGESNSGLSMEARIGNKFAIYGHYLYNQSDFLPYLDAAIDKSGVVPGQGLAKKTNGDYVYKNYSIYAAYSLSKYITVEPGIGKNFWGDGYRSLFISNNASAYPYLKITTSIWKIKYVNLYTQFEDAQAYVIDNSKSLDKKYGSFHYLSLNIGKRLAVGLYEGMIWQPQDQYRNRGFDVNYLNPIIFFRPIDFSIGSPANSLLGLNLKYKIFNKQVIYGQLLIDDFNMPTVKAGFSHLMHPNDPSINWGSWMNKQAFQLGFKCYDLLWVDGLNFQTEYNYIRPFVYSHRNPLQNTSNLNQSLASPLNANSWEWVSFLRYNFFRWFLEGRASYAIIGYDLVGQNNGNNIFLAAYDANDGNNIIVKEYKNEVGQGLRTSLMYLSVKVSYLINYKNNLRFECGITNRHESSVVEDANNLYIFAGFKTTLSNYNYDF